ncbi:MAG: tetratricopeptide repeat protein [Flavobacterium sp.]|jgi:tetratricopeptide (TPR) repeat protein|uniref:tetratricopeptide repeat protein n=1 Tax=Flavobacterium sp. TaxID=239 RepID=UPI0022BAC1C6|nr:tetratricopeptide repeat protein [Flavobacterium sp.]MCZ8168273.1 tetratricopeptide repeat protein [Flavobacterium sp.]MCZ8298177.1 tetratricopeptide repeat protein [Flavobacterium sp.]
MSTIKFFSVAFLAATAITQAQDLDQAKKAIDAEQYDKAKSILKSIIKSKPADGKAAFLLGNVYLKQSVEDSAKITFDKGLTAAEGGKFNNIGLGQLDLEAGNAAAAKAKFDLATQGMRKKEVEEYIYVAQAYMNADKPDYQAALAVLEKAKLANPNDAYVKLAMGDAYYGLKNQNDAYSAYRDAYNTDKNLIRAKMQLGVLLKGAKAYVEAVKAYDEVVSIDPNYGPVYRELAETYYLWASNKPATYKENIAKALSNYEKYMSLTDYSLSSRMRHADFLILAKEYKELEKEALEMKKMDKVNPRILRYLGYAAYENGNTDEAISALTEFLGKATKIIGGDYYFLGLAQVKKSIGADGKTVDATLLAQGVAHLKKAVEMDMNLANGLNEIGKAYFGQKLYGVAAGVFEAAILNTTSKNFFEDNIYYGLCVHTVNRGKDVKSIDLPALTNADKAMDNVIAAKPDYPEAYLYKARINSVMTKDDIMTEAYQKYLDALAAKGPEEITKNKAKVTEAYNNMASFYANSDKAKAKELLNKTLALDPTNAYATESLKVLK